MYSYKNRATVWRRDDFDPAEAVEKLYNATINESWGTDEDAVIQVMGNHTSEQRIEIAEAFKQAYGKDLIEVIKDELSGDFENTVVSMLTPPAMLDAMELHEAMSGAGTDETTLIEVLATKTNEQIETIKEKYKEKYETELEEDLKGDTDGHFQNLMVSLVTGSREENDFLIDYDQAKEDVEKLVAAGPEKWGTDEGSINAILCLRSRVQLAHVFREYEREMGTTIEEMIDDEVGDELKDGFLAIVKSTKSLPGFWAERIHKACAGWGTNDDHLIRIIVSRSEIDMGDIDEQYVEKYGKSVAEEIESECGGDYKRMLLALVTMQE